MKQHRTGSSRTRSYLGVSSPRVRSFAHGVLPVRAGIGARSTRRARLRHDHELPGGMSLQIRFAPEIGPSPLRQCRPFLPPVRTTGLTSSPPHPGMTAVCAFRPRPESRDCALGTDQWGTLWVSTPRDAGVPCVSLSLLAATRSQAEVTRVRSAASISRGGRRRQVLRRGGLE